VNNRHTGTGWSYDADGNLLQTGIPTITYAYDAAGRMIHTNNDSRVDITQSFDGDGQILKRYEVDTIYQEGEPPYTETSTLYQLRSTALGGRVLTEMGAQGEKFRTYVYANGALLAWQQVIYLNGSVYYQGPVWEHRDPSNASYRLTGTTSYVDPETSAELDPFSSNMGLWNPYQFPPDPPLPHKPNIFYPGFSSGSDLACRVDGYDLPCAEALRSVAAGAARVTSTNITGDITGSVQGHEPVEIEEPEAPSDVPEDPDNPNNPVTVKPPRIRIEWVPTGLVRTSIQPRQPQNPTPTPTPNPNC
jgi:YD repeat-containing protein